MTPLDPSLVFQFPAVRSLIFRGPCILLRVLEFLPNLDILSFLPSPFGYCHPAPNAPLPIESRMSSRSSSSGSNTSSVSRSSLFLELSQILQDKCPHITRLVLTEPSIMGDLAIVGELPTLLRTMPARLVHVELSLRGCGGEVERDVIQALVESHGDSLQSFVVLPLDSIYSGLDANLFPQVQQENMQQQQQRQQEKGCGDQGPAGGQSPTPTPSTQQQQQQPHTRPTNPPPNVTTDSHPLLSVLESCPSLIIADCHLSIPLQSVIASFPNWSCHSRLQVLRLELEELSGAGAMDADEEIVMEMFVKSMFIGSRVSVPVPVDVDVEDEVEMSEVSSGAGGLPFLPLSHSPTSSGSTTPVAMASSSSPGGSTAALHVDGILWGPSLLDETSLASASQSPSSSFSSWTTESTSSSHQAPSTTSTESTSLGGLAQDVGQSRRREEKQQRVLGQVFAMTDPPLSLASASAVSTASTVSSSSSVKTGGSYFSPPTFTTNAPSSSSSCTTTTSSPASTPSVSTSTSSSNQSQDQRSEKERKSREAASAFLLSCSNYQVDVVGKLTALQFLVEHQLATMPRLECFWLGSKMFQVPKRWSSSSPLPYV